MVDTIVVRRGRTKKKAGHAYAARAPPSGTTSCFSLPRGVLALLRSPMLFGCIFVRRSFVIPSESFTQVDATHWTLDVSALAGGAYGDVRDVCLFVPGAGLLPPGAGLALHVQAGDSGWEYRGAVSEAQPSDVFATCWPRPEGGGQHPTAQVGVSVEPLAELATREATAVASKQEFARRVALDMFRFMQSFPTTPQGNTLLVPSNVLEMWLSKFEAKFARDPDFLLRLQAGER